MVKYETVFKDYLLQIERDLDRFLPQNTQYPQELHEAMRYGVFQGGKRFRPILTFAACEAAGGKLDAARLAAVSLELIHCYSLIHDDLPALDNDPIRRGKPSVHVRYGEATAVLAGDGLLTLAFHVLSHTPEPGMMRRFLDEISTASGTYGMIGGQSADLAAEKAGTTLPMLDYISTHKTGKLIKASIVCGAIAADASDEGLKRLSRCGEWLGLCYQAVDDYLDSDGYAKILKPREIRLKIRDLTAKAKRELKPLGKRSQRLHALIDFLVERIPKRSASAAKQKS